MCETCINKRAQNMKEVVTPPLVHRPHFRLMSSSSVSQSWGDDNDALACLTPSCSVHGSNEDAGSGWDDSDDALAGVMDLPPSHPILESSDTGGWGSDGDALGHIISSSKSLSENAGVDIEEGFLFNSAAHYAGHSDLQISAPDDHWMNSDAEEDPHPTVRSSRVEKSVSCLNSPLASTSHSDSQTHSDYKLTTDVDHPMYPPLPGNNPNPRKQSSQEELFVGVWEVFQNLPSTNLNSLSRISAGRSCPLE